MTPLQYCPNCHTLTEAATCPDCQGQTQAPQLADHVLLRRDAESNINRLCAGLCEQDIAFWEEGPPASMTAALTKGFNSQVSVLVAYKDYAAAKAVEDSLTFAAPRPKKEPKAKKTTTTAQSTADAEEEEEISPVKKKLGKLLLVLSVLAAAALVVLGSDWIIGMVKGVLPQ